MVCVGCIGAVVSTVRDAVVVGVVIAGVADAVAVIIAGAFALIVASMTADLIMPIVGAIFGNVDFSDKYIVLAGAELVEPGMSLEAARDARSRGCHASPR